MIKGQNIKTNYIPKSKSGSSPYAKTQDEIEDSHADRRGLNRSLRREQSSPMGKVKRALGSTIAWGQERGREIAYGNDKAAGPVFSGAQNPFGGMVRMDDMFKRPGGNEDGIDRPRKRRRSQPREPRGGINSPDFWFR